MQATRHWGRIAFLYIVLAATLLGLRLRKSLPRVPLGVVYVVTDYV